VLLWASAFVAIRAAGHQIGAGPLALGRLVVGSVVLGVAVASRRHTWPTRREWLLLVLMGVSWFGLYNLALNEAEQHLDASIAAMVVGIGPIMLVALAGLVLREGFPRGLVAGAMVGFGGVVLIGLTTAGGTRSDLVGVVLCVCAAAAYAIGVVSQKPVLRHVSALTATWIGCLVGAAVCSPFLPALVSDVTHASPLSVLLMVYLGLFPTAIAFTTWAYALSHSTAGRMGATTYAVPPVTLLLGWLFLSEVPPVPALIGGALALSGVYITRRIR
jgi:drug/metabolite transporter (DMT)-like permease